MSSISSFQARRRLLQLAAMTPLMSAGSLLGDYVPLPKFEKGHLIPALNAYSFSDQLMLNAKDPQQGIDLLAVCDFCVKHDIQGLDVTGYFFPGYPAVPSDRYIYRLKRYAHDRGITITGTGVRNDFVSFDRQVRAQGIDLIKSWIEVAAKLGAPVVRAFAGPQQKNAKNWQPAADNAPREVVEGWMADSLRACAEHGEKYGVMVAVQNHGDFLSTAAEHISLLKRVNHAWCGALVDTGMYLTEDPYKDIAMMVPHAVNWQIKETLGSSLKSPRADIHRLVKILHEQGYRGFIPIETLAMGRADYNPEQEIKTLLTAMREAIAAVQK